jgi:hypothetical protein
MTEPRNWPGVEVKAWVDPTTCISQRATDPSPTTTDDPSPHAFIQWKGTDVCLDFYCPCGQQSHYDGDFAYAVQCPVCDREFAMPHTVQMVEVTE